MKLSVIAPTFNESQNVRTLVEQVQDALSCVPHEIIIVDDDSPDMTWQVAETISARDPSVRVLRRTQNRGLGKAVIDGFSAATGDVVACIDADLQHDPKALPKMLEKVASGADVAVASRYVTGGSTGNWNWFRHLGSCVATKMAQILLGVKLTDPMSGYFMMRRRDFLDVRPELTGEGFKIFLEILVKLRPDAIAEVPYTFRTRLNGESKLSSKVIFQYVRQLCGLCSLRDVLNARFLKFGLVGCTGILVNLAAIGFLLKLTGVRGWIASALASLAANLWNYILNNIWTFSDRLHKGLGWLRGYVSYLLVSTVGLGVTTASYAGLAWAMTQFSSKVNRNGFGILLLCQFVAILLGAYFNYVLSKTVTWPASVKTATLEATRRLAPTQARVTANVPSFENLDERAG